VVQWPYRTIDGRTIDRHASPVEPRTVFQRQRAGIARAVRRRLLNDTHVSIIHATVPAGCSAVGPQVSSTDSLLQVADVALQMAKRAGRNQIVAA
jgi:PleD family two-component response regulator